MPDAWTVVLQQHLASLPHSMQQNLKAATDATTCLDIIRFARGRRKGYDRLLLALQGLIDPIKRFEASIDVIIQVNSGIASPIWGPLRLVLGLASERLTTLQNIATLLERLVEPLSRFQHYETLFRSNVAVHRSICNLYTHLVGFCAVVIRYHGQSSFRNIFSSFDKEFRETSESIRHCWTEIDIVANAANIEEAKLARVAENSRRTVEIRADVLRWLSPSNVQDDLHEHSSLSMANSCDWILESPAYESFARPGKSTVLTILGRPGEGKTFLATFVVETLNHIVPDQVLYFFCKAGDPDKRTALHVLRTLLAQLLRSNTVLSEVVEEIYYKSGHAVAQSLIDVQAAFEISLQSTRLSDIYIVIDGLDECQKQVDLMRFLLKLTTIASTAQKAVHLMFCSRDTASIKDVLNDHGTVVRLNATTQIANIRAYAMRRVSTMKVLSDKKLQELVADEVCSNGEGLWLYVRLMLDEIQYLPNYPMIQHRLKNIPRNLQQLYCSILNKLASDLDDWQLSVARQLFLWVDINGFTDIAMEDSVPLTVLEAALQYAIMGGSVDDPVSLIHKLGGHMVDVYQADNGPTVVNFIHHTARQYVEWSSTAPAAELPIILKPRRLRALHCGAVAAWYFSQHPQAKSDHQRVIQYPESSWGLRYFEMAYALWGAFRLAELPSDLEDEESTEVTELCRQLTKFLSSELCLPWIEMAVAINYQGGYPKLLRNVMEALATTVNFPPDINPSFRAFQQAKRVFFLDYAHVIRQTGPDDCLLNYNDRNRKAPIGFNERTLAQKLLQIGSRYTGLNGETELMANTPDPDTPNTFTTSPDTEMEQEGDKLT